jgi:hypothetical protein
MVQVELAEECVAEMVRLSVIAVGVEPAHHRPADEVIAVAFDSTGGCHRTVAAG